jgi:hypothetical protein
MLTVFAILAIIITLVASELYLVYSNYRETAKLKTIKNYSSR